MSGTGGTGDEARIAESVEKGSDDIAVPQGLLDDRKPGPEKSQLQRLTEMRVPERIKLALRGNREARMFLIRDTNPMIRRFVLRNPRISEEELLAIAKTRSADEELLRTIAGSRDWTMNYQIRLAVVTNPKTPLVIALRLISTIHDRDLRRIAKSKNVPVVVASQAKRLVVRRPGAS